MVGVDDVDVDFYVCFLKFGDWGNFIVYVFGGIGCCCWFCFECIDVVVFFW